MGGKKAGDLRQHAATSRPESRLCGTAPCRICAGTGRSPPRRRHRPSSSPRRRRHRRRRRLLPSRRAGSAASTRRPRSRWGRRSCAAWRGCAAASRMHGIGATRGAVGRDRRKSRHEGRPRESGNGSSRRRSLWTAPAQTLPGRPLPLVTPPPSRARHHAIRASRVAFASRQQQIAVAGKRRAEADEIAAAQLVERAQR